MSGQSCLRLGDALYREYRMEDEKGHQLTPAEATGRYQVLSDVAYDTARFNKGDIDSEDSSRDPSESLSVHSRRYNRLVAEQTAHVKILEAYEREMGPLLQVCTDVLSTAKQAPESWRAALQWLDKQYANDASKPSRMLRTPPTVKFERRVLSEIVKLDNQLSESLRITLREFDELIETVKDLQRKIDRHNLVRMALFPAYADDADDEDDDEEDDKDLEEDVGDESTTNTVVASDTESETVMATDAEIETDSGDEMEIEIEVD